MSGLVQSPSDKGDVVGGTAAAAGLGDDDGQLWSVSYLPESTAVHDLSDHHQGGIAGVIVDVFQTHVDGGSVGIRQNLQLVAEGADRPAR